MKHNSINLKGGAYIVNFEEIKIPKQLEAEYVRDSEMDRHKKYYDKHNKIKSQLIVNSNGELVDGYIDYLILKRKRYKGFIKTYMVHYEQDQSSNRKQNPETKKRYVYDKFKGRCYLCGDKVRYSDVTIDHILPLAKGGINDIDNLACCCRKCNMMKGSLTMKEFVGRAIKIAKNYK